jgi:hypothetical protein
MKFISPDEFNELCLPIDVPDKVIEACRCIFILGMHLNIAVVICGITNPQGMIDLFDAMELIIAQIGE